MRLQARSQGRLGESAKLGNLNLEESMLLAHSLGDNEECGTFRIQSILINQASEVLLAIYMFMMM